MMKTRGVSRALTIVSLLFLFASCQEEEFLEKDHLDTLKDEYERSQIPDDEAEQAWDDPENNPDNPDYVPPGGTGGKNEDGSNDGGSSDDGSGSNDGGSSDDGSGSNDGGSSDDGSGSNDGGSSDDGSGSNDGGSSDDGSGSNDGGSSDDGSGSNDGGSSDDGSGSNDGGSDDGSDPDVTYQDQVDTFIQRATGSKLDILWVIDNSGSMGDEQKALGDNFEAFIKEFVEKDIDFQMAVTTTDTSRNNAGREYKDSIKKLTSEKLKSNKNRFMKDFAEMVKVGTRGSGFEKGIKASEVFTNRFQNKWLRDDAYYAIVYVSDEEDQSEKDPQDHLKQISKWKDNAGLIKAYSIVDMVPTSKRGAISRGYERYNEMSVLTGGSVASIKSDFYDTLLQMGEEISSLTERFPLSETPADSSAIVVYVDGVASSDWSYDATSNSIQFSNPPRDGSEISVEYEY